MWQESFTLHSAGGLCKVLSSGHRFGERNTNTGHGSRDHLEGNGHDTTPGPSRWRPVEFCVREEKGFLASVEEGC